MNIPAKLRKTIVFKASFFFLAINLVAYIAAIVAIFHTNIQHSYQWLLSGLTLCGMLGFIFRFRQSEKFALICEKGSWILVPNQAIQDDLLADNQTLSGTKKTIENKRQRLAVIDWYYWSTWVVIFKIESIDQEQTFLPIFFDNCTHDEFRQVRVIAKFFL